MDARMGPGAQVFRPRQILTVLMVGAGLLWLAVLVYLLQFRGVPVSTLASAIFFVLFFAVSSTYYARTAIYLDPAGVTFRGMVWTQRLTYADIRKVDVLPGPVTIYAIRAPGRLMHFTSFFAQHQRLVQMLVERAGLAPSGI